MFLCFAVATKSINLAAGWTHALMLVQMGPVVCEALPQNSQTAVCGREWRLVTNESLIMLSPAARAPEPVVRDRWTIELIVVPDTES